MAKPADTKSALTDLLSKKSEKASPTPALVQLSAPKAQTIYLRATEQQFLRDWRIDLASLDAEGRQPSTSEIVRVALRLMPKDRAQVYEQIQLLREEDGRK